MKKHEICEFCKNKTWNHGMWFMCCDVTWSWCEHCGALFDGEKWHKSTPIE